MTALNLVAVAALVLTPSASLLLRILSGLGGDEPLRPYLLTPLYCSILFIAHSALNFPFEFWYGYALDRQYGLARSGARAWVRAWIIGVAQHAVMFIVGSCLIVITQLLMPRTWLIALPIVLLVLFVLTQFLEADLLPIGLFQLDRVPALGRGLPVSAYGHIDQRERTCVVLGLGARRVMLISCPALAEADPARDSLCRDAIVRSAGPAGMLRMLLVWGWLICGILLSSLLVPRHALGSPLYIPWLAMCLSIWILLADLLDWNQKLAAGLHRLWMWVPNVLSRTGGSRLGRPHAWFIESAD